MFPELARTVLVGHLRHANRVHDVGALGVLRNEQIRLAQILDDLLRLVSLLRRLGPR